jgi:hypothetical protein
MDQASSVNFLARQADVGNGRANVLIGNICIVIALSTAFLGHFTALLRRVVFVSETALVRAFTATPDDAVLRHWMTQ